MPVVTVITDVARTVDANVDGDRFLVPAAELPTAIGWTLKPEGLCRAEVCVPVTGDSGIRVGDRVDVAAAASALNRPCVVDPTIGVVAVALDSEARHQALDALHAPPFTLNDLEGVPHEFAEWSGRKRLLIAFSSW